jgi:uncharacterized repeat protein (TIGR01451 family)
LITICRFVLPGADRRLRGEHMPNRHAQPSGALRAGVLASVIAVLALGSIPAVASAAVTGTVAGTAFEDYNSNGVQDAGSNVAAASSATDNGVKNATVKVIDSTGATVGSAATDANGAFSFSVTAATAEVRVQVAPPGGFNAGPQGPDSASTVQFVTLNTPAASAVEVALSRLGDFSPDAPVLLNVIQSSAIRANGSAPLTDLTTEPSIVSSGHADRGDIVAAPTTPHAMASQTGSVWGLAQLGGDYAFTSAFLKRHAKVGPGPGGLGQIYLTDLSLAPNASPWVTIPNAGANPRANESAMVFNDWFHDPEAYPAVYKRGLGALAMAPDHKSLYVINLNSKSMWRVPFSLGPGGTPVAGTPAEIPIPLALPGAATGCPSVDDVRPFGVTAHNGALWVTLTCTGPAVADLRGYVYRYDLATATFGTSPAFEELLSGHPRGIAWIVTADWNPWTPDADLSWPAIGSTVTKAQPLLSDVAFDANGDMTIGVKDRMGDETGNMAGQVANIPGPYTGFPAGDVARACRDAADTMWVLENNAQCGTRTGALPGNLEGPGGGEFYNDNYLANHAQISLGALLQLPGYGQLIDVAFDPGNVSVRVSGYRFLNNVAGSADSFHELLPDANTSTGGGFGKAGGLGDMVAMIADAPLEIGNRLWFDTDFDGVQDPGELPVAGATVNLYAANGTTVLATAVTDSGGNYYFSNAPGTTTANAIYGLTALTPESDFFVRVDRAADFAPGGPLNGYSPTQTTAGPDASVESNGQLVGGVDQAAVKTGLPGVNDHTIDFGFITPTYAVGDYVWFDSDKDGTQDPGEAPVPGVTVTLIDPSTGLPAKHPDGTPVAPVVTDVNGHYVIDFLPAGSYQVQFSTFPAGYHLTTQGTSGGSDSNPVVSTGLTPPFSIGPSGGDMRPVVGSDGTHLAVAINPTIDAGLVFDPPVIPVVPVVPVVPGVPPVAPGTVDLTVTKRADKATVDANEAITWTVVVVNRGPGTATGVVALDEPSLPTTFTSVTSTRGTCSTRAPVRCELGTMVAGASATITLIGRAGVAGTLRNEVEVSLPPGSPTVDPVPANNSSAATTRVRGSLTLAKSANRKTVRAGGRITYAIRVTNPTMVAVRDARVCDRLPSGLIYVSSTPAAKRSSGRYCWALGTVAAKSSKNLRITVRTLRGTSGRKTNVATLVGSGITAKTDDARVAVLAAAARGGGVTG